MAVLSEDDVRIYKSGITRNYALNTLVPPLFLFFNHRSLDTEYSTNGTQTKFDQPTPLTPIAWCLSDFTISPSPKRMGRWM